MAKQNKTNKKRINCLLNLRDRERKILLKGGLLNYIKGGIR